MNHLQSLKATFFSYLQNTYALSPAGLHAITFSLNTDSTKKDFGDISTNASLMLAKELKKNPAALGTEIAQNFSHPDIQSIQLAGPGFLNFFMQPVFFAQLAQNMFQKGPEFFKGTITKESYSVEFVSANPTGPLHLGHGRGGIIGDVFANILTFLGYDVVKEFYINDAGKQIENLGASLKIRCQQQLGIAQEIPEDGYHGTYLIDLARICLEEFGNTIVNEPVEVFAAFAKERILNQVQHTLDGYGIHFDVWFSETTLHSSGAIEHALEQLRTKDLIYTHENSLWFKSTAFGDDKDRVLKRSNGIYTYAAADIAYLQNKLTRGFDKIIMILGQDHHSYATRLKAIMQGLGYDPARLHVILYQLVTLKEDGELLRMSKRAGTMVTLQNIIDTVGTDVARFFYLNRKADAHLDFDLDLALKKTDENPVYYIQYAYVRAGSILKKAEAEQALAHVGIEDLNHLDHEEIHLIKKLLAFGELLQGIVHNYQTHLLSYYVHELAGSFHSYYNKCKVIDMERISTSRCRIALTKIVHANLELCLKLLGVQTPEKM